MSKTMKGSTLLTGVLLVTLMGTGFQAWGHEGGGGTMSSMPMMTGTEAETMPGQDAMAGNEETAPALALPAGAQIAVKNTRDGAVLTVTSRRKGEAGKIQAAVKNFVRAQQAWENETVVCPVMGTKMKRSGAYDQAEYKGRTYYFCCGACKPAFLKDPGKYVKSASSATEK